MARFRYSMDFGYGMTLIDVYDNKLNHVVSRNVSEFTESSGLEGTFKMEISDFADITTLVLDGVYVNAVAGDIGKQVEDDAAQVGVLLGYDNALKTWWIRTSSVIADNSVMTIASGTGAGDAFGAGVYSDLNQLVETTEVIDFQVEEDQNRSGAPSWIVIFSGNAHLRGKIDDNRGLIEIFQFTQIDGKLESLLRVFEDSLAFSINGFQTEIQFYDGTDTYSITALATNFVDHLEDDIFDHGVTGITLVRESLPFDSEKLQIFPTKVFDKNINFSGPASEAEKFSIKDHLQIPEDLFQTYWYIDETIPATSKMIFFRPEDDPISRMVLDGVYVNCIASDIGKSVNDDAVSVGFLIDYDNTNQVWWVRLVAGEIADNSVITITAGTGAGTAAGDSDNSLFFTQPQLNVEDDVTNLQRADYIDPEMVWKENFDFANDNNDSDFVGFPLRYPNPTKRQVTYNMKNITTNCFPFAERASVSGESADSIQGLSAVWVTDQGSDVWKTDTGTGIISSTTISNEYLSIARLHDNWYKTNRFHIRSGIYINDSLEALPDDTVEKHIRNFPDYKTVFSAVPSTIGTLRWQYDNPDELISLVTKATTSLESGITVMKSRQFRSWLT